MINYRAVLKCSIVVAMLVFGIMMHFPAITLGVSWTKTAVHYVICNNTTPPENYFSEKTWDNLTGKERLNMYEFPFMFLVPIGFYYGAIFKTHRKKLIINGSYAGVVMWIYGLETNSSLYDFICILKGFQKVEWKKYPTLWSRDLYHGKVMVYYKIQSWQHPLEWHKISINNPNKQISIGFYKIIVTGKYREFKKVSGDNLLNYDEYFDEIPYQYKKVNRDKFQKMQDDSIKRIRKSNIEMMQSNPEIVGPMIESSLFIVPNQIKGEFLDLLPPEEKIKYVREGYAKQE